MDAETRFKNSKIMYIDQASGYVVYDAATDSYATADNTWSEDWQKAYLFCSLDDACSVAATRDQAVVIPAKLKLFYGDVLIKENRRGNSRY